MKILAFADTRTTIELPKVEPDLILLLGDIPSKMVYKIDKYYSCPIFGVFGNHCHPQNFDDTKVLNFHEKFMSFKGIRIAGFEGSPRYNDKPFGQHSEREAAEFIKRIGEQQIDIFMAHSNPAYDDKGLDDTHRGFEAFNGMILNNQVKYFFHGHLHDPFIREIGKTRIYSVYPYLWLPDLEI